MKKNRWEHYLQKVFPIVTKISLKVRLSFYLILLSINITFASVSYSQLTSNFSIYMEDVTVREVLEELENQSGYYFLYSEKMIDINRKVNLNLTESKLEKVLDRIFEDTDVEYEIKDMQIVLSSSKSSFFKTSNQEQVTISGKVTDASGSPLPGVTVMVKGTTNGTITNMNGEYVVTNVPEGAILQFSFVGMLTEEVIFKDQTSIDISLVEDIAQLDEVVVIGYGSLKKKDLTSSVTTISQDEFNKGTYSSPVQLLQGKVPGLNITSDGNPFGSASIILRGPSTLRGAGASSPFYVIDGVPGASLSLVPTDDIVSIDVLRDASATAIYGSRAANGVIIVTTKRGEAGQSRISYSGYTAVESISNKIDMLSADEYRNYLTSNGLSLDPANEDNVNTDWMDEVCRLGISHQNNVSIGGGNDKTTYIASANFLQNQGIIKGSSLKRFTLRANVEQKAFNDRLKLSFSMSNTITDTENFTDEVLYNMIHYLPTVNVKNPDGTFKENYDLAGAWNPLALIEQNTEEGRDKLFLGSARAQLNILDGWNYQLNASYQNSQSNAGTYNSKNSAIAQGLNGQATRSSYESENKIIEMFTTYEKTYNKHDFKVLVGYSWQEDVSGNGFQTSNVNFVSDETSYYNLGLASPPSGYLPDYGSTGISTLRMISVYSRLNYQFDNKYLLQATIRRDGSSAFGENNQWGTFPSASVAWRITQEEFMQNQRLFHNLKLRVGYGESGNSIGFDPLVSKIIYGSSGYLYYNGEYITSVAPVQNANPDLKWERTAMLNIGLDFAIFKGRVNGTIEYYGKHTKDMIWGVPVSTTQYFVNTLTANVGEMSNKGFEVSLNAVPVETQDFSWNTTINISHNKNEVTSMSNDLYQVDRIHLASVGEHGQSGNTVVVLEEGYPIGQFYIWGYAGKAEDGTSQFYTQDGDVTINPTSDDHFYAGDPQPKAIFGWYNTFTYKKFDLNFLVRGVTGNKILNVTLANLNYPAEATHYNMPRITLDESINDNRAHYVSDRYIENGDYVRLDNLTLGYTFKLTSNVVKNLRLYSTINNVFVITGYTGLDPEVDMGGNTPGIDNNNYYPKTRTFLLGVNVDF